MLLGPGRGLSWAGVEGVTLWTVLLFTACTVSGALTPRSPHVLFGKQKLPLRPRDSPHPPRRRMLKVEVCKLLCTHTTRSWACVK